MCSRDAPLIQGLWLWLVRGKKRHFLFLNKSFWIQHPEYVYCHCLWNALRLFFFFNSLPGVHSSITAREQASRSLHSRTLTELRRSETNSQVLKCDKSNRISPSQYPYRCESMTLITASYYTSQMGFRSFFFMKGAPVIHREGCGRGIGWRQPSRAQSPASVCGIKERRGKQ